MNPVWANRRDCAGDAIIMLLSDSAFEGVIGLLGADEAAFGSGGQRRLSSWTRSQREYQL